MTLRGIVRDGVIVIPEGEIPDGTTVRVVPDAPAKPSSRSGTKGKKPAKSKTKVARKKASGLDKLIGIWKDRPDWKGKSTLQIVAELRQRSTGSKRRG